MRRRVLGPIPVMLGLESGLGASVAILGPGRDCCAALEGLGGGGAADARWRRMLCTAEQGEAGQSGLEAAARVGGGLQGSRRRGDLCALERMKR